MEKQERNWPVVGQKLVHRFKRRRGEKPKNDIVAKVLFVNKEEEVITLRIGSKIYPSLTAAAKDYTNSKVNGWAFWGLKKRPYVNRKKKNQEDSKNDIVEENKD